MGFLQQTKSSTEGTQISNVKKEGNIVHFYTSINNNYFAKARILAKTIKQHCKNARFSLVLSDNVMQDINWVNEPFDDVITIDKLGIPVENLNLWIYIHTVVELCTAVKGQALVKFLEEGSDKVVYLDPDIAVFDDLHELEQLLDEYDVLLTPHQTIPENKECDILNNEICSLKHGVYNYGFYAVRNSENGLKYARWWRDRLLSFCYDDIPNGLFTDQRWGDLAPALFEGVYILRDPGCNVSTWNITTRKVTKESDGRYYVNGSPLKFYHFSGFDSGNQEIMLNLQGGGNQHLFALRKWYIRRQNEEGQEIYFTIPSIYNFYDNGEQISREERQLMRSRMDLLEYFKDTNPAVVEQTRSYYKWYRHELSIAGSEFSELAQARLRIKDLEKEIEQMRATKAWKIAERIRRAKRGVLKIK